MIQKLYIHEHPLSYEEEDRNIKHGVSYLRDHLSAKEAEDIFGEAHDHGSSHFEDKENHKFTLLYQNTDGLRNYFLISLV